MEDEKWHIQWIKEALQSLEPKYGADTVEATIRRFREADRTVYRQTMLEHEERIQDILKAKELVA